MGLFLVFFAVAAVLVELWFTNRSGRPAYDAAESETDLGIAFGWLIVAPLTGALSVAAVAFAGTLRVLDLGSSPWSWILLFLSADFLYYAWHRANRRWRWLWATHVVHHSARRITFLTSFRQGWTDAISGTWLFWMPLGLLGFSTVECGVYFVTLLVWQFWVHNEWAPRLGPLEWVLVTPSHHRVHHSLASAHVDHNFGGVFIIWDRLFATFVCEGELPARDFGVAGYAHEGIAGIVFGEWLSLARDNFSLRLLRGRSREAAEGATPTPAPTVPQRSTPAA